MPEIVPKEEMTLREFWNQTPRWQQAICVVAFIFGCVLLMLGLQGDADEWWATHPYKVNMLSTATGAAFGIPLVVLVYQWFGSALRENVDRYDARQRAYKVALRMCELLDEAVPIDRGIFWDAKSAWQDALNSFNLWWNEAYPDELRHANSKNMDSDVEATFKSLLSSAIIETRACADRWLQEMPESATAERLWDEVALHWQVIDGPLKFRSIEMGQGWPISRHLRAHTALAASNTDEFPLAWGHLPHSVTNALQALEQHTSLATALPSESKATIREVVEHVESCLEYVTRASEYMMAMNDIEMFIGAVMRELMAYSGNRTPQDVK